MDLLNKTFTVFRMSVVVTPPAPELLSQRLRDALVGDTVRGVEIPGDDTPGDAGALVTVNWYSVHDGDNEEEQGDDENTIGSHHRIEIVYERNTFLAYLFLQRRILLCCGPAPVRSAVVRFLTKTLDTRASLLVPASAMLIRVFETWLEAASDNWPRKDIVVTLGFGDNVLGDRTTGGGLRSLDVTIPAEDSQPFIEPSEGGTFSDRLTSYLDKHLALNMRHSQVKVTKISCGGFVLGDGKVKLLDGRAVLVVLDGI